MSRLSVYNYLKEGNCCTPVNLFQIHSCSNSQQISSNNTGAEHVATSPQRTKGVPRLSLIVDSESCLDRLYGGYYSDWASGGQWNRMLSYVGNLSKACQANQIQLTIALRGGLEQEHATDLFKANRDFKDRLNRVILHLQNRGTPPPKVWWLPPTCFREVLSMALQASGIAVLRTNGDYYTDVMGHLLSHNMDGILTDDPGFALLCPTRFFAAHDFKLTYKGSLDTKEYFIDKMTAREQLKPEHISLLASLLGNHIISPESLEEFHQGLLANATSSTDAVRTTEETEMATIEGIIGFVRDWPCLTDVEAISKKVFAGSTVSIEDGVSRLRKSIGYYESFRMSQKGPQPAVVTSELEISQVRSDGKQRKKNTVVEEDIQLNGDAEGGDTEGGDKEGCDGIGASNETTVEDRGDAVNKPLNEGSDDRTDTKPLPDQVDDKLAEDISKVTINGDDQDQIREEEVLDKLRVTIQPSDAILKLARLRHGRGLMSSIITQSLIQREVRLPCYIENTRTDQERMTVIEIYRPIRQSIYAILHNLNKHLYDMRKIAEYKGNTVSADDISINICEHYLGPLSAEVSFDIEVKPVPWPVPSVESLWLGVKPENKGRRMKAFLSSMNVYERSNPLMTNPDYVPERFLLICCVLRYLLKCDPAELTVAEVDAALAAATSTMLFDIQTMQDLQLPLITPRGVHVASLVMAGIQHAMLVNDTCGAPIRVQNTSPWLYFDGKLLQYKLLKTSGTHQLQRLDLCDGNIPQVITMEKLRQAVMYGLESKFGEKPAPTISFGLTSGLQANRFFPAAFLRPHITGRGKTSLMGNYMGGVNSRLDGRGGKLQIAGQVVATWGPRPTADKNGDSHAGPDDLNGASASEYHGARQSSGQHRPYHRRRQGYQHNRHSEHRARNQNANNLGKRSSAAKSVLISAKEGDAASEEKKTPADSSVANGDISSTDEQTTSAVDQRLLPNEGADSGVNADNSS